MSDNPLSEASPESLSDLFAKDPLLLTDDDVERIVTDLREARKNWVVKEKAGSTRKAKGTPVPSNISIDDLDLDL